MKELLISVPGLLSNDQIAEAVAAAIRLEAVGECLVSIALIAFCIGAFALTYKLMSARR